MTTQRYTISMSDAIMNLLDQMAEEDGMTRSGMIAYLVRQEWKDRLKQIDHQEN
jgi:metal-responsive CopG/Arc/MetJ family transcriptional regulator